tara:strand:- start:173 stop:913 length:741 start_codon:yes stop_codon:yes gene_type:complete
MAWEDRIQRLVRRPKPADFSGVKERYLAETQGGYPRRRFSRQKQRLGQGALPRTYGLKGRGLGSFENQMMMDQLRGPAGMNLANQPQKSGRFLDLLKQFRGNLFPGKALESLNKLNEEKEEGPKIIPIPNWVPGEDENSISNIGDTGYFNEPYFEMGSGIELPATNTRGTRWTGVPWGDADYNLGRVYPDPNEVLRPVEKRQFPMNIERGPFGDARDVNPNISVYEGWYENPWQGYNRGGIASLRR